MMPTPQDEIAVQRAYDQVADTYANHFRSTEPELPVDLGMIELFASFLPSGKRVLDAGCGAGRMMPVLATFGCQVEGVDFPPEMIRRARQGLGRLLTSVGMTEVARLERAAASHERTGQAVLIARA
ncbi:class I SAM-dependent methyltransferase [Sinomonas sp. P47F7]|uniref:class I SAM-dependent methyltransferase n=1 Tax=Sinomonas sp. P47F7 TaxID=3410987 RepID=UPI003BF5C6DE